jgi:fructose/tagatose bisphosphate aldolase
MRSLPVGGGFMSTLREVLQEARANRVAIGHFNFSELVVLKAATQAASELGVPVVMGLSESEREFLGVRLAAALVEHAGRTGRKNLSKCGPYPFDRKSRRGSASKI